MGLPYYAREEEAKNVKRRRRRDILKRTHVPFKEFLFESK